MIKSAIGLVGLGVMGRNLVLNIAEHGFRVSAYSREVREVEALAAEGKENAVGFTDLNAWMASLSRPKVIMLMITAGSPVDEMIEKLLHGLEPGDIVMDGGNSYFKETMRRCETLQRSGLHYLGVGVSGGAAGARHGASIMPGGSRAAWEHAQPILMSLAAKDENGEACCTYMGPNGAGHFVKMVHNGIEYAEMQLLGEAYDLMKTALGLSADRMHHVFAHWNRGILRSYLTGITANILSKRDTATGHPLVDMILDRAGQKGTGQWAAQEALELGCPAPTLAEAVFSRCLSALKEERLSASTLFGGERPNSIERLGNEAIDSAIKDLEKALYASKISVYAQGFALMKAASERYGWDLKLANVAAVWRGGCIIQSDLTARIHDAYVQEPGLTHLYFSPCLANAMRDAQSAWRSTLRLAMDTGVSTPAFGSALAYYDAYRSAVLPANLLQAQRDYFGAHTYERTDQAGRFHTEWTSPGVNLESKPV